MIFEKQVLNMYKGMMHTRCDDTESVFYFSVADFPGLTAEPFAFTASAGHKLQGYVYHYENYIPERVLVFDHGFGGGHRAYMKEIELLCKHGYQVLSYDHTGCMESEGESPNGMAQSLSDLNDCITAIKKDERFCGLDISVMGHSWGGFSTLNISALHPDVSHIVVLSGFVCVEDLVNSFFGGVMKGYRKPIMELEKKANPRYVSFNAVESLCQTNAHTLLVYSENDKLCNKSHFDTLKEGLSFKNNIKFLLENNKGHNPNYTEESVTYLDKFSAARAKLLKKKNLTVEEKKAFTAQWDWNRMTEQDELVWNEIFACLDK